MRRLGGGWRRLAASAAHLSLALISASASYIARRSAAYRPRSKMSWRRVSLVGGCRGNRRGASRMKPRVGVSSSIGSSAAKMKRLEGINNGGGARRRSVALFGARRQLGIARSASRLVGIAHRLAALAAAWRSYIALGGIAAASASSASAALGSSQRGGARRKAAHRLNRSASAALGGARVSAQSALASLGGSRLINKLGVMALGVAHRRLVAAAALIGGVIARRQCLCARRMSAAMSALGGIRNVAAISGVGGSLIAAAHRSKRVSHASSASSALGGVSSAWPQPQHRWRSSASRHQSSRRIIIAAAR